MALNWTARYIADWADVRPEPAGIEHEQAYLAGAGEFAQLDTPLEFASLYVTAKCHLRCMHCHAEGSFQGSALPEMSLPVLFLTLSTSSARSPGGSS